MRRLRDARQKRAARQAYKQPRRPPREASQLRRAGRLAGKLGPAGHRNPPGKFRWGVRPRKRLFLGSLGLMGVLALLFAVLVQSPDAAGQTLPINSNEAGPDVALAGAGGIEVSTPVRPADLRGLGYHPGGEGLLELQPRGKNVSANPLLGLFGGVSNPEDIKYHVMDREEREGPGTGALDVGADAGATVYAPVTGTITAVRPDPTVQDTNVVEIKPSQAPNSRVFVSLVRDINGDVGPDALVTAGTTEIGSVPDLAGVLEPQLSSYTGGSGNHVTVFATGN